jgi:hypothetical protein
VLLTQKHSIQRPPLCWAQQFPKLMPYPKVTPFGQAAPKTQKQEQLRLMKKRGMALRYWKRVMPKTRQVLAQIPHLPELPSALDRAWLS